MADRGCKSKTPQSSRCPAKHPSLRFHHKLKTVPYSEKSYLNVLVKEAR